MEMFFFLLIIPIIIFVVVAIVILVSNVKSVFYGAPFVPIKKKLVKEILAFSGVSADDIFYDLGCGDGRVLISAVRDFGVKKAIGYEISPWPYLVGKWRAWRLGLNSKIEIHRKNFFDVDLTCPARDRSPQGDRSTASGGAVSNRASATFIYAYLFPKLIDRLAEKIARPVRSSRAAVLRTHAFGVSAISNGASERRSGTKILCPSFPIDLLQHPEFKLLKTQKIGTVIVYLYGLSV